jgi:hypothetical protein
MSFVPIDGAKFSEAVTPRIGIFCVFKLPFVGFLTFLFLEDPGPTLKQSEDWDAHIGMLSVDVFCEKSG